MQQSYIITQIKPDIFRISLPMKGRLPGPVNVYLIKGEVTTLIDTGAKSTRFLLLQALNELGLQPQDIDQLIITHGHPDHFGAANFIRSQSHCVVYAHTQDKYRIENNQDNTHKQQKNFLKLTGMPWVCKKASQFLGYVLKQMAEKCRVDMTVEEDDTILVGDYQARIIHTPGHAKGCICIHLLEPNFLFSGDLILEHITPNPVVMFEPTAMLPVRLSQEEFYSSVNKILDLDPICIFTGHGREVSDLPAVIAMYNKQFSQRQRQILNVLESGQYNAYQITCKIFSHLKNKAFLLNIFLATSEVFTHLQVLEKNNKVVSRLDKKQMIYALR